MKLCKSISVFSGVIFLVLSFGSTNCFAGDVNYTCGEKGPEQIKLEISQATTSYFTSNDRFLFFKAFGCAIRNKILYRLIGSEVDTFAESSFREEGGGIRFKDAVMYYSQNKNIKAIASATMGLIEEAQFEKVQKQVFIMTGLATPYNDLASMARACVRLLAISSPGAAKASGTTQLNVDFFRSENNLTRAVAPFVLGNGKNLLNETITAMSSMTAQQLQTLLKETIIASDGVANEFISLCKSQGIRTDPSGLLTGIRQSRKSLNQIISLNYTNGLALSSLPNLREILLEVKNYYWTTFKVASFYAVSIFFDVATAKNIFNSDAGAREFLNVVLGAPQYKATLPNWAKPGERNH